MNRTEISLSLVALLCLVLAPALPAGAHTGVPESWLAFSEAGPWVVRVELQGPETALALDRQVDVWHVVPREGYLVALVTEAEYHALSKAGYAMALDEEQTRTLEPRDPLATFTGGGIPGFACYRTVEETLATAANIAQARPELARWIDIGDSWAKTQDPDAGYDMRVLVLTNSAVTGPKPIFFASFAIHSREYATAELGTRFAEHLVDQYGADADVTWLLDHHEIHLLLQANPDGRKRAEGGLFWRKNANNEYCSNTDFRGADLNRNFSFEWNCCGGSSGQQCDDGYRGPAAASEPEIQAHQSYVQSIFPDQRGPALDAPSPDDATGVAIDVHSFGELVLWPWGLTLANAPNATALTTLGRKLAFFNGYEPIKITELTVADGSSADFYYGELGVAGFGFEIGNTFFQDCPTFESTIVPENIESLLYAAKVARTPFMTPAGPEAFDAVAPTTAVEAGQLVTVTARLDDTRFSTVNGAEPSQTIAAAELFVDTPPWAAGALPLPMAASDGTFDQPVEAVEATVDTAGLAPGRHLIYIRGVDGAGNRGSVTAAFLEVAADTRIFADGFEAGNTLAWSQ